MPAEKSEKGIIKIISEMIREGETEDKILKTLKALGAKDDEARRMLLVSQAQTFDQLKTEIGRIVETQISGDKPILKEMIKAQIEDSAKKRLFAEQAKEPGKKQGFFSRLFSRIFKRKTKKEAREKTFETEQGYAETQKNPEFFSGQEKSEEFQPESPEMEKLEGVYEKIKEEPRALRENLRKIRLKITRLESWQTRYQRELNQLKHAQEEKKLSEEQLRKKAGLSKKIREYKTQIALLNKVAFAKEDLEMEQLADNQSKGQIIFKEETKSPFELKTMTDLAEAAKAIMLAAGTLVRATPKPKIVIESNEGMLNIDQQIEQMKRMQKRMEIDFYKRRIPLPDFQEKVMDYQSKLYELEEKKKILEKTKSAPKNKGKKLSGELEKIITQKLSGRISDEKMMEIENYLVELLNNYKMPEQTIAREIKPLDSNQLLASLEKLVKMNELQRQAEQEIEKKGFQFPWLASTPIQENQVLPRQTETMQQPIAEGQAQKTIPVSTQTTAATTEKSPEETPRAETILPKQQEKKGIFGKMFGKTQKKENQQYTANVKINQTMRETKIPKEEQKQQSQEYPEKIGEQTEPIEEPAEKQAEITEADAASREEGWNSRQEELEEMQKITSKVREMQRPKKEIHIKPLPITRFFKKPREEPRRVIIEPIEETWSEVEMPTFPTTLENKEKEKIKTTEKEIRNYLIETDLDRALQIIKEKGTIRTGELQKETKIEKKRLEELINILENESLIKIEYPAFGDTIIKIANYVKPQKKPKEKPEKNRQNQPQTDLGEKKKGLFGLKKTKKTKN
jgi:hypothetical protein